MASAKLLLSSTKITKFGKKNIKKVQKTLLVEILFAIILPVSKFTSTLKLNLNLYGKEFTEIKFSSKRNSI